MMTGMVATQPEKLWDVDLDHLRSQITAETVGIIVTNPSNPCGSVYTADHLKAIIKGGRDDTWRGGLSDGFQSCGDYGNRGESPLIAVSRTAVASSNGGVVGSCCSYVL